MAFSLSTLFRRSAERKAYADLMKLDDHLLHDIGVSRSDLQAMMAGSRRAHAKAPAHE